MIVSLACHPLVPSWWLLLAPVIFYVLYRMIER